jgi:Tfp pilus assembly protein PilF
MHKHAYSLYSSTVMGSLVLLIVVALLMVRCSSYDRHGLTLLANQYLVQGEQWMRQHQFEKAEKAFKQAVVLEKVNNKPLMRLASFYEGRLHLSQADFYYKKALSFEPKALSYNNYGVFLCKHHHYQKGLTYLMRVCQHHVMRQAAQVSCYKAYHNAALCAKKIPNPILAKKMEGLAKRMVR